MTNKFVCKVDYKSFSTEVELMNHLLSNYAMVDSEGGELSDIHKKLKEVFPFAIINVEDSKQKDYGKFLVNMKWEQDNGDFHFYVGENKDYDYYYQTFDNVEKAIQYYQAFFKRKNEILVKLKEKFTFDTIEIHQMYEGDMHNNNGITFLCTKDGKEYFGTYEFGDIDIFVSSFRGYFDRVIEGEVVREYNHADGYEHEPTVGGVPIKRILERAKTLRIEILEEK